MSPAERRDYARRMFIQHPEHFPEERRAAILNGQVTLGMAPFEARLAGGAFTYEVTADPLKWKPHTNPLDVMWAQSASPDDSRIVMSFTNASQYPGEPPWLFKVVFERGRAVSIDKVRAAA